MHQSPKSTFGTLQCHGQGKDPPHNSWVMISGASRLTSPLGTVAPLLSWFPMWAARVSLLWDTHVTGCCSYLLNQAEGLCCERRDGRRTSHLQLCRLRGPLRLAMGPGRCVWEGWTWEGEALTQEKGAWLLICTCLCTWVGVGVSVPGEGGGAGTFTCLTNNVLRIDCRWSAPELGQGASPWLLFTSNHAPGSVHRCVFRASTCTVVLPPEEVLVPSDNFSITFHRHVSGKEQVSLVDPQYLPRRHVKLDPPSDLQSNVSSDHCVLTWSVSPALEPLTSLLSYELAFKRQEEAWERARHRDRIVGVTRLLLEGVELEPGAACEARLRVQMAAEEDALEEERYKGQWSEWSQPVRFPAPPRRGPPTARLGQPNSTLVAVSIFLLLTSLTYLLFKLSPRVKRTFHQNVPSPVTFFQPLYSVHNGNFQSWTGAHKAGLPWSEDCMGTQRAASESSIREAIALLTYDLADPLQSVGLEEEGTGSGLPAGVLPAGCMEWGGQLPAYLPQEDWVPASPARPAPSQAEGSSSDYCALGCDGGCHPSTFLGNVQSSAPILALACGHSCDQQSLDAQHGGTCVGAAHSQRQDLGEQAAGGPQGVLFPPNLGRQRAQS
ncbi:interleukin-9 receptor [Diceros bicornis minor]|uniref:interleukin-9 receptor n=1 Tax=Diceros bicornis minor TaxID=77932 RepID=UPI0026F16F5B|nr:interleukin-9 receptor [Diceros bicornis minor]